MPLNSRSRRRGSSIYCTNSIFCLPSLLVLLLAEVAEFNLSALGGALGWLCTSSAKASLELLLRVSPSPPPGEAVPLPDQADWLSLLLLRQMIGRSRSSSSLTSSSIMRSWFLLVEVPLEPLVSLLPAPLNTAPDREKIVSFHVDSPSSQFTEPLSSFYDI